MKRNCGEFLLRVLRHMWIEQSGILLLLFLLLPCSWSHCYYYYGCVPEFLSWPGHICSHSSLCLRAYKLTKYTKTRGPDDGCGDDDDDDDAYKTHNLGGCRVALYRALAALCLEKRR